MVEQNPKPSVLYYDSDDEEPIFLSGELDRMLSGASAQLRALTLEWIGLLGELRPAERERLEPLITRLRDHLLGAWQTIDPISDEMERIGDDRRARAGEVDTIAEVVERHLAEEAMRVALAQAIANAREPADLDADGIVHAAFDNLDGL